jgi:hypothetical protein
MTSVNENGIARGQNSHRFGQRCRPETHPRGNLQFLPNCNIVGILLGDREVLEQQRDCFVTDHFHWIWNERAIQAF